MQGHALRFATFRKSVDQTGKGRVDLLNNVSLSEAEVCAPLMDPLSTLSLAKMSQDADKNLLK
jgi:hypothetical protein